MILFIHTGKSTFVNRDIRLLSKHFPMKIHHYKPSKKFSSNLKEQFKLFWKLAKWIWQVKSVYIWFADYHSFLPVLFARIFNKQAAIVLGGYDVTYIPEIKYGSFSNPIRRFCTLVSLKFACFLLPVDRELAIQARKRVKRISGKVITLPTGYDPTHWYCDTAKENIVLTVAVCRSMQRIKLKGIDFFLRVAEKLPQHAFKVIGIDPVLIPDLPRLPNVTYRDSVDRETLRREYSRAKVYAQFSLHEGLPNVLCEAMLCECIPVGSHVGGIPTAIDGCGYLIKNREIETAKHVVIKALKTAPALGKKAREHILNNFPLSRREQALLKIFSARGKGIDNKIYSPNSATATNVSEN